MKIKTFLLILFKMKKKEKKFKENLIVLQYLPVARELIYILQSINLMKTHLNMRTNYLINQIEYPH